MYGHLQRIDGVLELAHVEVHLAQHEEDAEVRLLHEVLGHDVVAEGVFRGVLVAAVLVHLLGLLVSVECADHALDDLLESSL